MMLISLFYYDKSINEIIYILKRNKKLEEKTLYGDVRQG